MFPSPARRGFLLATIFICTAVYLLRDAKWRGGGVTSAPQFPLGRPLFKPGEIKLGHSYRKAIVVASVSGEDTTWVRRELPDIDHFIYVNDDPTANLTVPVNKGNEAMTYLTMMIDHYHNLPDVMIFAHAHRDAYHNPWLLQQTMPDMVQALNPYRVIRHGYVNLHCGDGNNKCWAKTRPSEGMPHEETREAWKELFPQYPVPDTLIQMPAAQFAVSRERVLQVPLDDLKRYRQWLIDTPMSSKLSGFVFEMLYQFILRGERIHCPPPSVCYCDLYGICMDEYEYDKFDQAYITAEGLARQIEFLNELEARYFELSPEDVAKRDRMWNTEQDIRADLERMKAEAIKRGYDQKVRDEAAAHV